VQLTENEDRLLVEGVHIPGENLVLRAARFLRDRFKDRLLPNLDMRLVKYLPPGSGVGAGSGNAAALLRWFFSVMGDEYDLEEEISGIASIGADVAFLASGYDLAFAGGIGERLEGIDESGVDVNLPAVVIFPRWSNATAEAYASLDRIREQDSAPADLMTCEEAREESRAVLRGLAGRKHIGLLPNDFLRCASEYTEHYGLLYNAVEKAGAIAWGLCGSGSSCFALFDEKDGADAISRLLSGLVSGGSSRFDWIHKTLVLE
jgi:4-diphosphocytidyl-2-C-methyl-D-erythritol kinase